jgi:AcrR family transcriptional regulator
MSGRNQTEAEVSASGAKVERTRRALLEALQGLVRERRYDEIEVGDIVQDAAVGRSTFYDHYRGKDDMLVVTMGWMLDSLAGVAAERADVVHLEFVLRHFAENRKFARHMLASPECTALMARVTRELAQRIEAGLRARFVESSRAPAIPLSLIAAQLAEAQFALVRAWLADDRGCTAEVLAGAMRRSAAGSIAALC